MAAKKKITVKKSSKPKPEKRPQRQFYTTYDPSTGKKTGDYPTKAAAERDRVGLEKVAGPYMLLERKGNE